VTARGGDVSGDEEEGDEEGCQEKEVISAIPNAGGGTPQRHSYFILVPRVRQGEFHLFFSCSFSCMLLKKHKVICEGFFC
jgi:hypothetical protein